MAFLANARKILSYHEGRLLPWWHIAQRRDRQGRLSWKCTEQHHKSVVGRGEIERLCEMSVSFQLLSVWFVT